MNMPLRLFLHLFICLVFAGQSYATTTAVAYGYGVNVFQSSVENHSNNGLISPSDCCRKAPTRDSQDRAQARAFFALAAGVDVPKGEVWNLKATDRGNAIEAALAKSDYKDWYNVGNSHNGYFPLVDFQKGNTLVSLKSVDTTGKTWLTRMETHIDDLATRGATVDGKAANESKGSDSIRIKGVRLD